MSTATMPRCRDCRFWNRLDWVIARSDLGVCSMPACKPIGEGPLLVGGRFAPGDVYIATSEDFGCTEFEAREEGR